jgi:hypothetical protein
MPRDNDLIYILQKLYAGEAQLNISFWDEGWTVALGDKVAGFFARRKFTPEDILELPSWIEQESAKPRPSQLMDTSMWPRFGHLRLVK